MKKNQTVTRDTTQSRHQADSSATPVYSLDITETYESTRTREDFQSDRLHKLEDMLQNVVRALHDNRIQVEKQFKELQSQQPARVIKAEIEEQLQTNLEPVLNALQATITTHDSDREHLSQQLQAIFTGLERTSVEVLSALQGLASTQQQSGAALQTAATHLQTSEVRIQKEIVGYESVHQRVETALQNLATLTDQQHTKLDSSNVKVDSLDKQLKTLNYLMENINVQLGQNRDVSRRAVGMQPPTATQQQLVQQHSSSRYEQQQGVQGQRSIASSLLNELLLEERTNNDTTLAVSNILDSPSMTRRNVNEIGSPTSPSQIQLLGAPSNSNHNNDATRDKNQSTTTLLISGSHQVDHTTELPHTTTNNKETFWPNEIHPMLHDMYPPDYQPETMDFFSHVWGVGEVCGEATHAIDIRKNMNDLLAQSKFRRSEEDVFDAFKPGTGASSSQLAPLQSAVLIRSPKKI